MNHEEWLESVELYAVGALDGEELHEFEAHLAAGCATCAARLHETRDALVHVATSLEPVAPRPRVKAQLMTRIGDEDAAARPERFGFRWSWPVGVGALAAAGLVLVLSWKLIETQQQLTEVKSQLGALGIQVKQNKEIQELLSDPQVRSVILGGVPPGSKAKAVLLWNATQRKGMLLTIGLPQTPAEKAYELWGLAGSEAVPAGVFTVSAEGSVVFPLPKLPESKPFDKFAVTVEPAGGVPKATGPIVLVGSM